jgi:hypothetical protein
MTTARTALFVADPHDWNPQLTVQPVNIAFSGIE